MRFTKSSPKKGRDQTARPGGFTLVELIALLAVLVILGFSLAPSLARTKPSGNSAQCLNHLRQLAVAWRVYSEDYNGRLVSNSEGSNTGLAGYASWAGGWLDLAAYTPDNTNVLLLVDGTRRGGTTALLGPYSRNVALYKCPSDRSTTSTHGISIPRVRSVSLNSRVGENATAWKTPTAYRLYKTSSSLVAPTPSEHFIFTDEREDSINDSVFLTDPDTQGQMIDFPGAYHSGGANFAFADGRAELHRWLDPRTVPPINPAMPLNIPLPGNPDVLWLQQHASSR